MVSKIDLESFLKINYDDLEIGKIYKHSKEWEQCWDKTTKKHGWIQFCYHNLKGLPSTPMDIGSMFMLINKELDGLPRKTIIYTILYKEKIVYRYFYFNFETIILSKKPILNLVSD